MHPHHVTFQSSLSNLDASHASGKHPRYSDICWNELCPLFMESSSDTLTILNCCCAGTSTVAVNTNNDAEPHVYRKALIISSAWNQSSYSDFGAALNQTLRGFSENGDDISTETLVAKTNTLMSQKLDIHHKPSQAHHHVLHRTIKPKIVLEKLEKKSVWNGRIRGKRRDYAAMAGLEPREDGVEEDL
jgi:hypothetical protein